VKYSASWRTTSLVMLIKDEPGDFSRIQGLKVRERYFSDFFIPIFLTVYDFCAGFIFGKKIGSRKVFGSGMFQVFCGTVDPVCFVRRRECARELLLFFGLSFVQIFLRLLLDLVFSGKLPKLGKIKIRIGIGIAYILSFLILSSLHSCLSSLQIHYLVSMTIDRDRITTAIVVILIITDCYPSRLFYALCFDLFALAEV